LGLKTVPCSGGTLLEEVCRSVQKLCSEIMDLARHAKAFENALWRVDSLGIVVFFSYSFKTVASGETGLKRRRRRSNRPGNSQAKGPCDEDSIWKEAPRVFPDGVRRRDNTLRHSDRWGFDGSFGR
jgi:hypothetical protein